MPIDFISVLLILGIGQCIFLAFSFNISPQSRNLANAILGILLLVFFWFQFEFFLLRHKLDAQIPFLYSTRYGSWLLVGPLILLYNRALLLKDYRLKNQDLLHFLPFFILSVLIPTFIEGLISNRSIDYGMLTVFDRFNREPIKGIHYFYGLVFIAQFIHALLYIFWTQIEIKRIIIQAKGSRSNLPEERIKSLRLLYQLAIIIIVFCSLFVIYQFSTRMWRRNLDYLYVLPTLIFVFGLAYRAMRFPNSVFILSERIEEEEKYQKSGLHESARKVYLNKLEEKIQKEKIYQNNELSLKDLAQNVEVSTHHLSQLINENYEKNFFDFINGHRVEEAKEIIKSGEYRTLLEVAFAVGFNNKNSFNNAFKKQTGTTPSAYRKKIEN